MNTRSGYHRRSKIKFAFLNFFKELNGNFATRRRMKLLESFVTTYKYVPTSSSSKTVLCGDRVQIHVRVMQ